MCTSVVSALTTSNINWPYGFGRNGTVFGVAPSRSGEQWLVVASPQLQHRWFPNIATVFRTEDTRDLVGERRV
jgi:hypothetical protein